MCPRVKLSITDPPKVWVSGFLSVDGNAKLVLAITENGKNGHSSPKKHPRAKLEITDPPKVWVSGFPCVKMRKMTIAPQKCKTSNYQSP